MMMQIDLVDTVCGVGGCGARREQFTNQDATITENQLPTTYV